jgi:predicted  nucleic acid-binding Zn-ribbon protein
MRPPIPLLLLALAHPLYAQKASVSPNEELRTQVSEWVETMRKIQQEENDWSRDKEVLKNYKEGLEKEILDLKEQIASAKTRKEGGDQQSLDKVVERDRFIAAQDELTRQVRVMETDLASKLALLPDPFKKIAKISVAIESLQRNLQLPADQQTDEVGKRLTNVTELLAEIEKFQQSVQVYSELRKDSQGHEYNMQVLYFGLGLAFAVNEDSSFALAGRPGTDGWKFQERNDLAPQIQKLLVTATSEKDVSFTNLPLIQP